MFWAILAIIALTIGVLVYNHNAASIGSLANDDLASLVILSIVGLSIGSGVLLSYSGRWGKAARDMAAWAGVAFVLVVGYAYRDQLVPILNRVAAVLVPGLAVGSGQPGELVLERAGNGHFNIRAKVNGQSVFMVVDTGATLLTLTDRAARSVGFDPANLTYSVAVSTANGTTSAAPVVLDRLELGSLTFTRVEALVAQPGALAETLLGLNVLNRLSGYEVRGNRLFLRR